MRESEDQQAGSARRRPVLAIATAVNLLGLVILWVVEQYVAERYRYLVWLTYIPQHPIGIPLLLLLAWSLIARQRRMAALNAGVAVGFLLTFIGFNLPLGGPSASNPPPIRLMTLNTKVGIQGVDRIARLIEQQNPDIVCLQETRAWRGYPDPVPAIMLRLKGWNVARDAEVTTLSRHAVMSQKRYPMIGDADRVILQTTIRLPQRKVNVFNVHYVTAYRHRPDPSRTDLPQMSYRAMARWEQTSILFKAVESVEGPVLVAGDFNNPPRGMVYRRLASKFADAFRAAGWGFGFTFRSDLPLMRIDYIFVSPEFSVQKCYSIASHASDHRAVVADLEVKAERSGGVME